MPAARRSSSPSTFRVEPNRNTSRTVRYAAVRTWFMSKLVRMGTCVSGQKGSRMFIRPETEKDHDAVRQVNRLAFGQDAEPRLVDALRAGGFACLSLVAEQDSQVVGHIMFSDLSIITQAGTIPALALAPMAVLPDFQNKGIGST